MIIQNKQYCGNCISMIHITTSCLPDAKMPIHSLEIFCVNLLSTSVSIIFPLHDMINLTKYYFCTITESCDVISANFDRNEQVEEFTHKYQMSSVLHHAIYGNTFLK